MKWLPKSRIRYNARALDPILAAAEFGYKFFPGENWQDLDIEQQSMLIAAYRAKHNMASYQAHEASGSKL
jgi:hypothetical protein